MSFVSVAAGQQIRATHVQQFTNWLTGSKKDTPGVIACTSTADYALVVRSEDGTTGQALSVQYGAAATPTTIATFTKQGLAVMTGTSTAPAITVGETGTGLFRATAGALGLRANNAVTLTLDGTSDTTQRVSLTDPTFTKYLLLLSRGSGISSGIIPDTDNSGAFGVVSFQSGGTSGAQGEAIKGYCYAASGTGGGFIGVSGIVEAPASSAWVASGASVMIGLYGSAFSYRTSGRTWGANVIARSTQATQADMSGIEVGVEAMGPVVNRYGVSIVTLANGNNSGSSEDLALRFIDKVSPTTQANLWDTGLAFGAPGIVGTTGFPVKTSGTLIKSYGTSPVVACGLDFSNLSMSSTAAAVKTPFFMVTGAGRAAFHTSATPTQAPVLIDANGESYTLQIENPVTATSAGTIATYLLCRIGNVDRKIAVYATS